MFPYRNTFSKQKPSASPSFINCTYNIVYRTSDANAQVNDGCIVIGDFSGWDVNGALHFMHIFWPDGRVVNVELWNLLKTRT